MKLQQYCNTILMKNLLLFSILFHIKRLGAPLTPAFDVLMRPVLGKVGVYVLKASS